MIFAIEAQAQDSITEKRNSFKATVTVTPPNPTLYGIYRVDSFYELYQPDIGYGASFHYEYRPVNRIGLSAGLGYIYLSGDDGHLTENSEVAFHITDIDLGLSLYGLFGIKSLVLDAGYLQSFVTSKNNVNPAAFNTSDKGSGRGAYLGLSNLFEISNNSGIRIGMKAVFRNIDIEEGSSFSMKSFVGISPAIDISYSFHF
ncbi:MAG: hypothetical protein WD357_09780 [Gracilimonas sp.]